MFSGKLLRWIKGFGQNIAFRVNHDNLKQSRNYTRILSKYRNFSVIDEAIFPDMHFVDCAKTVASNNPVARLIVLQFAIIDCEDSFRNVSAGLRFTCRDPQPFWRAMKIELHLVVKNTKGDCHPPILVGEHEIAEIEPPIFSFFSMQKKLNTGQNLSYLPVIIFLTF